MKSDDTASTMDQDVAPRQPGWLNYEPLGALVGPHGLESTPFFFGGKLHLMQSMEAYFAPDGGAHSFFCVFDAESGEKISCPESSSGFMMCSAIVQRQKPGKERLYVYCPAWDRANLTSCPNPGGGLEPHWGCGACAEPGQCYIGSWWTDDLHQWHGPAKAIPPSLMATLNGTSCIKHGPPNSTGAQPYCTPPSNVAVSLVPPTALVPPGLPRHQAFMAFEISMAIALNVGTDGDLSKNWILLSTKTHGGQGLECPTVRYRQADGFYYVFGDDESVGEVKLHRSKNLTVGSWEAPPKQNGVMISGCVDRTVAASYPRFQRRPLAPSQDCNPKTSHYSRIAPDYFTNYWRNGSDRGGREFLFNESEWNWSVGDPDLCSDSNGNQTYLVHWQGSQTAPVNWTAEVVKQQGKKVGNFIMINRANMSDVDFLASYFGSITLNAKSSLKTDDHFVAAAPDDPMKYCGEGQYDLGIISLG